MPRDPIFSAGPAAILPPVSENAAIPLGPFDLVQPAGRGAMAEVWRAIHRARGVPVAVKVVTAPAGRAERYRRMFADEVRSTARLDHPGVIRLHDHGEIPDAVADATAGRLPRGAPFLVMAWVDGGTLQGRKARMSWPAARATLLALLDALAHAHARGVIHRDLKAANVLIGEHGPILTDFGLAFDRDHVDADLESSARLGTPNFMAPEQVAGEWRALGPWTDLYALGCLAYTLVTGSAPFAGRGARRIMAAHLHEDPPPLRPAMPIPAGFETWVRRLLQKHPDHRYRFAADAALGLLALPDAVAHGDPDATFPDGDPLDPEDMTLVTPPVFLPLDDLSWAQGPTGPDGRPPVPTTWRSPPPPAPDPPLTGVGRALFGLRETALVGRETERDRLWTALATVATGGGARALVIEGPAGQGKSHLAAWIAHRAHELGVAEPMRAIHDDVQSPACGLGPMLELHLRCTDLPPDARLARIREALNDPYGAPEPDRDADLAPALAAAMSVHRRFTDLATSVTLYSDRERYETLCRGFACLARRRPLILWFDDVQWGLDALRFTHYLLDRYGHLPLLVIATVRDDALSGQNPEPAALDRLLLHPTASRLRIGPLDPETLARMVQNRLPINQSLAELLARRTGGSPLFAEQLVHHWIRTDALTDGPDGFRLKSGTEAELPADLAAVWQTRLDSVLSAADEGAWQALEAAAVLGIAVDRIEWHAVCALADLQPPTAALERLLDERLARLEDGGRWAFAHAMLRETLLQRARAAGRLIEWNTRCAAMLAAEPGRAPARLAGHLIAADRHEAALDPLLDAIRLALERGDYPVMRRDLLLRARVLRAARRPLTDPAWIETRIYWARLDVIAERLPGARRRAHRAVIAARALGDPRLLALALIELGRVEQTGDPTRSIDLFIEARTAAIAAHNLPLEAEALRRTAWCLALGGKFDPAEAMHEAAIACLGPTGDEFTLGGILHTRTLVAWKRGQLDRARRIGAQAMECFEHTGDRFGLGNVSNTLGDVARYDGDLVEAERWYRQAIRLKNAVGSIAEDTELNLAVTLVEMGRYPEARERIEHVETRARRVGHPVILAFCAVTSLPCDAWAADWGAWDARWHDMQLFTDGKLAEPDAIRSLRLAASLAASVGETERADHAEALAAAQEEALGRA